MKRFVLLAALFVAVAIFLLWLAPAAPSVPLEGRVLYRTNHPSGQFHYLVGVTNLSGGNLRLLGEGERFPAVAWATNQPPKIPQIFIVDLAPHAGTVVALIQSSPAGVSDVFVQQLRYDLTAPGLPGASNCVVLGYSVQRPGADLLRTARAWLRRRFGTKSDGPYAPRLVLGLPPE